MLTFAAPMLLTTVTDAALFRSAEPFLGVTHHQYIQSLTDTDVSSRFIREIVVNTLEIDLTAPGISVLMQPGNTISIPTPDAAIQQNPGIPATITPEYVRKTTRGFVNEVGAQMGVNLDFYSIAIPGTSNPEVNFPNGPSGEFFANGVYAGVSNGVVASPNNSFEPIFNVSQNNLAQILTAAGAGTSNTIQGVPLYNAIGGNQLLLQNGINVTPIDASYTVTVNPHTALGVSQDGKRIFLMTVDGRQNDYAEGMRTDEMGDLLRYYGAWEAINVDGGGSTTMVMDDTFDSVQNARVINSPSDGSTGQTVGSERLVASNMAVFAQPNPDYVPLPAVPRPAAPASNAVLHVQTVLDSFEDPDFNNKYGHFAPIAAQPYSFGALGSGSNRGISASSTMSIDSNIVHTGDNSLKVDIVSSGSGSNGFKLRLLSGGASQINNIFDAETLEPIVPPATSSITNDDKAMGSTGYVGFFIRLEEGSQDLYASILLDDGTRSSAGLERGSFQLVTADGDWHLMQWSMSDADQWFNFASGNGAIGGPNTFIDGLYFSSAASTASGTFWSGTFWIDNVVYNPDGPIIEDALFEGQGALTVFSSSFALGTDNSVHVVPEPASLLMLGASLVLLVRRSR
ncbi:MAG: PEP-CTERM sorting domain-containing protein [Phycisphaerales bacterium]|nr:PEP-CTERM sorting domain-containing protein [Phycisphaerales bacterium]